MIYLDNAATTKMNKKALDLYLEISENNFANSSSTHRFGLEAENLIEGARKSLANIMNVQAKEIYFTGNGTYSNNLAINGIMGKKYAKSMITSQIEHPSVYNTAKKLEGQKRVLFLPVDSAGFIDMDLLENSIDEDTALVSIMHVNNEIGTIQDIERIGSIVKDRNPSCIFHVDGVQGFGKADLNLKRAKVDMYSISGHKFHGPKGIGAIYIRDGLAINPILFGGGHERGICPGTEDTAGICSMVKAAEDMEVDKSHVKKLKSLMEGRLLNIEGSHLISPKNSASPYILNVAFEGIKGEVLLHSLEEDQIYISTGSACTRGELSSVIRALNLPKDYSDGCIRISFSDDQEEGEIVKAADKIEEKIGMIRKIMKWKGNK